jgi:hypothetical protein
MVELEIDFCVSKYSDEHVKCRSPPVTSCKPVLLGLLVLVSISRPYKRHNIPPNGKFVADKSVWIHVRVLVSFTIR